MVNMVRVFSEPALTPNLAPTVYPSTMTIPSNWELNASLTGVGSMFNAFEVTDHTDPALVIDFGGIQQITDVVMLQMSGDAELRVQVLESEADISDPNLNVEGQTSNGYGYKPILGLA